MTNYWYVAIFVCVLPMGMMGAPFFTVQVDSEPAPKQYCRTQLTVACDKTYTNPFNPDEVDLHTQFTAPSGTKTKVNGFWDGSTWRVRFAAAETGNYDYVATMKDTSDTASVTGSVAVAESDEHGWIRISPKDRHYLEHADGTPFYGVGFCRAWNVGPDMFPTMTNSGCNTFVYWLAPWDNTLLDLAHGYDRYNMAGAANLDNIIYAAESNHVSMILTVWGHPLLRDKSHSWKGTCWTINPFNKLSSCTDFFTDATSWKYQQQYYRYLISRWGYSQSVAMWHTICEITGTCAYENSDSWHRKVNDYFVKNDPFRHITTGSRHDTNNWSGGFNVMDCVQVHNYWGRTSAKIPGNVAGVTAGIADNVAGVTAELFSSYNKPNFHGEFGMETKFGEKARTAYQHNGIWAALMSGAACTPMMWTGGGTGSWGTQTADMYTQLRRFRKFVDTLDMPSQGYSHATVTTTFENGKVWGLLGKRNSIFWLQDLSPGQTISKAAVSFSGLPDGNYWVRPYHCWTGAWASPWIVTHAGGIMTLTIPDFQNDIAVKIERLPARAGALRRPGDYASCLRSLK